MRRPNPANIAAPLNSLANRAVIERLAPTHLHRVEGQAQPRRMVEQPVAKFPVAQNQPRLLQQRNLAAHRIVGQAAGAEQDFDLFGLHQFAEQPLGGAEVGVECGGAV